MLDRRRQGSAPGRAPSGRSSFRPAGGPMRLDGRAAARRPQPLTEDRKRWTA